MRSDVGIVASSFKAMLRFMVKSDETQMRRSMVTRDETSNDFVMHRNVCWCPIMVSNVAHIVDSI